MGGSWVARGQTAEQVRGAVEAAARALYERLFAYLVGRANQLLDQHDFRRHRSIRLLDIAGFEVELTGFSLGVGCNYIFW